MLAADFLHLEKEVNLVNECADLFHLDIMDGTFVPNISYGFPIVEAIARKAVKPLDAQRVCACAGEFELIVTCEEHNILGGLGSAVAEVLAENPGRAKLLRLGITGSYCTEVGDQRQLRGLYGLTGPQIAQRILKELV